MEALRDECPAQIHTAMQDIGVILYISATLYFMFITWWGRLHKVPQLEKAELGFQLRII